MGRWFLIQMLVSLYILAGAYDKAEATFCNYRHYWGLSWTSDSRCLLFHSYQAGDGVQPGSQEGRLPSYLCLLDTKTNSYVPCGDACLDVHQDPHTGYLFVASDIGYSTASAIGEPWSNSGSVKPYGIMYHPTSGSLSFCSWQSGSKALHVVSSLDGARLGSTEYCAEHGYEEDQGDEWTLVFDGHENELFQFSKFTGEKRFMVPPDSILSAESSGNRLLMLLQDGYHAYRGPDGIMPVRLEKSPDDWASVRRVLRVIGPDEVISEKEVSIRPPGSSTWIWCENDEEDWLVPLELEQPTVLAGGRGIVGVARQGLMLLVVGRPDPIVLDSKAHNIRRVEADAIVCAISSRSETKSEWRVPIPDYVASATNAVFSRSERSKQSPPPSDTAPLNKPSQPIRDLLLDGVSWTEETAPVLVESATVSSATGKERLVEYPGGAWLERSGKYVLLHCRSGQVVEVVKPVENMPDARIAESIVSPSGNEVALVIDVWHVKDAPHATGIISVYDLETGTVKARMQSIVDCDDSYGY